MEEKELLMFAAVIDMVKEGVDINNMKVSDITTRAGIGKGTAYEYFSSKEEIITKALAYDVEAKLEDIIDIIENSHGFQEQMYGIFDYIAEKFAENQTFCTLVRIGTGSYEMSENFRKEYERIQDNFSCNRMEGIIDRIIEQGRKEGILQQENPFLGRMAFSAQIIGFATYLITIAQGRETGITKEEVKEFAYKALVSSMN